MRPIAHYHRPRETETVIISENHYTYRLKIIVTIWTYIYCTHLLQQYCTCVVLVLNTLFVKNIVVFCHSSLHNKYHKETSVHQYCTVPLCLTWLIFPFCLNNHTVLKVAILIQNRDRFIQKLQPGETMNENPLESRFYL